VHTIHVGCAAAGDSYQPPASSVMPHSTTPGSLQAEHVAAPDSSLQHPVHGPSAPPALQWLPLGAASSYELQPDGVIVSGFGYANVCDPQHGWFQRKHRATADHTPFSSIICKPENLQPGGAQPAEAHVATHPHLSTSGFKRISIRLSLHHYSAELQDKTLAGVYRQGAGSGSSHEQRALGATAVIRHLQRDKLYHHTRCASAGGVQQAAEPPRPAQPVAGPSLGGADFEPLAERLRSRLGAQPTSQGAGVLGIDGDWAGLLDPLPELASQEPLDPLVSATAMFVWCCE
jgi:hypothetical protein